MKLTVVEVAMYETHGKCSSFCAATMHPHTRWVGGHKGGMRSHPPRVPAVGGEQYRRTRTKVIHGRSRVVTIIIIISR